MEDCVELAVRGLKVYVHGSEERLIQAARGDKIDVLEAASVLKRPKKEKRLEDWEKKVLHGQYLRQTKQVRSDQCWSWLQNGYLKRETESLIVGAQNQSIRTNLVKAKIDKSQGDSLCRMCRKVDENIDHILLVVVVNLHRRSRREGMTTWEKIVHWKLARKCNFEAGDKWYEHEPESVLENEDYKILWDFSIQTDHVIEARRPDLVVVDKKERSKIIDFAVPGDSRIEEKEKDKIEKYQELGRELQKIWNVKVKIIPLVVGSLGAIAKQFGNRLKQIGIAVGTAQVQKTVLLGTARILRKVLEI